MKYFLCGFSGSGKSTVLAHLNLVDFERVDLDQYLEKKFQSTIEQIFQTRGESFFRQAEADAIVELLANTRPQVVALGGGSLTRQNLESIKSQGHKLIFLDLPFENCWKRIAEDPGRPLVAKGPNELRSLYQERLSYYRQADYQIDAHENSEDICRQIEELVLQDCQKG